MTGQELKSYVEDIIEETFSDSKFLSLLNREKRKLERKRNWNFLKAFDNSNTSASGDTYLTMKTLPTDFMSPISMYISGDSYPYKEVPFVDRENWQNRSRVYYIDYINSQMGITAPQNGTINLYYKKKTADLTLLTSPVFPVQYHEILAYGIIEGWYLGEDTDDLNNKKAMYWQREYNDMLNDMKQWDAMITANEQNNNYATVELRDVNNRVINDPLMQ